VTYCKMSFSTEDVLKEIMEDEDSGKENLCDDKITFVYNDENSILTVKKKSKLFSYFVHCYI